jgi:endoplasmic reticulum-Golgi intermediate compartment protein 2
MLSVIASISATVSGEMGYLHFTHSPRCLLTIRQTLFDISQATLLQEHTQALSVRQAIAQSRKSRGLLDTILRRDPPPFKPTYNYRPDGSACRIFGTVTVKKVTGEGFRSGEIIQTHPASSQPTCTSQLLGMVIPVVSMLTTTVS